jgi:hypothetical protein
MKGVPGLRFRVREAARGDGASARGVPHGQDAAPAMGEIWTVALLPPASVHKTSLFMVEWFHSITAL